MKDYYKLQDFNDGEIRRFDDGQYAYFVKGEQVGDRNESFSSLTREINGKRTKNTKLSGKTKPIKTKKNQ